MTDDGNSCFPTPSARAIRPNRCLKAKNAVQGANGKTRNRLLSESRPTQPSTAEWLDPSGNQTGQRHSYPGRQYGPQLEHFREAKSLHGGPGLQEHGRRCRSNLWHCAWRAIPRQLSPPWGADATRRKSSCPLPANRQPRGVDQEFLTHHKASAGPWHRPILPGE